jgi:alkaline phosphatase D
LPKAALPSSPAGSTTPPEGPRPLDAASSLRLAFGSCNRVDLEQPLWRPITAQKPAAWVWLGDCVYADTENIELMRAMYARQAAQPDYQALTRQTLVTGVWDDHDYGRNDAGHEYPVRAESQQAFLDFLGVGADSERRRRAGVYTSHVFGEGARALKLILLDARYHRHAPGPEADVLGPEQWAWLEAELRGSEACVHVIGSGIQVLPEDHGYESWSRFPRARAQLLDLLRSSHAAGVVLISGDRHFAELSCAAGGAYPLYELTSSGLTHSWENHPGEPNRHRRGEVFTGKNFGLLELMLDDAAPPERPSGELYLSARDETGHPRLTQRLRIEQLRA